MDPQGPFPARILARWEKAFSLFVSNLPVAISKTKLETMFSRAGKVIDSLLSVDCSTGKKRGFGFVGFRTEQEALAAVDLAKGRLWGGRRISVNFARSRM